MINKIPYTNFHELNQDWIIRKIKELGDNVENIDELVNNWLEAVNITQDVNNYLDEHLDDIIEAVRGGYVINVSTMVKAPLDDSNIVEAINKALEISDKLYIPSGDYTFNIDINTDCTIYLNKNTTLHTETTEPCIRAHDCSFSLLGGNLSTGRDTTDRTPIHPTSDISQYGVISLDNCYDGIIEGIKVPFNKYASAIRLKNCKRYTISKCSFNKTLYTGVLILDTCQSITVDQCQFTNLRCMTSHPYCYGVTTTTKLKEYDDPKTPADDIVYTNNYVHTSEDCALDVHGGTNIKISNNRVMETVNAITAYNDNGVERAVRPSGWKMYNVEISNNICVSHRDIIEGNYNHGFIFVGGANVNEDYDCYSNCRIINNYFSSPNSLAYNGLKAGLIYTSNYIKNFIVENNVIDCQGVNRPIRFNNAINFRFANNVVLNGDNNGFIQIVSSIGEWINNTNCRGYIGNTLPSILTNVNNSLFKPTVYYMLGGQIYFIGTNTYISRHLGWRLCPLNPVHETDYKKTFNVTTVNGISTIDGGTLSNNPYLPGLAITYDGTNAGYIYDIISTNKIKITNSAGVPIADGAHTITIREADPQTI